MKSPLRVIQGRLGAHGVQERAIPALETALEKTAGLGARIDLVLAKVRVGLFFADHQLVTANIAKALE